MDRPSQTTPEREESVNSYDRSRLAMISAMLGSFLLGSVAGGEGVAQLAYFRELRLDRERARACEVEAETFRQLYRVCMEVEEAHAQARDQYRETEEMERMRERHSLYDYIEY